MATVPKTITRPQSVLLLVGSLGPFGHLPASGTLTVAVLGLPLFRYTHSVPAWAYTIATVGFALTAVWIHAVGDRILGEKDSRKLVWDELVGFLVAVAFVPFSWRIAVVALLLERVLDITKVPPAGWIEKRWPGGYGVVGDDIVAGAYTCAILHGLIQLAPSWLGVVA